MELTRRGFARGAVGLALGSQLGAAAFAQSRPGLSAALAAIRAHGEAHLAYIGIPGMTLGLTAPDGFSTVLNFGFADREARSPITSDTLFQIGSISKVMTAAVLHQMANERRFSLSDRASDLLPSLPLPSGNAITLQHLIDHVAGLPGDEPLWVEGGQRTAYAPSEHWHYSNTAYEMLGKIVEHFDQKPLARLLAERLFRPLGMTRTRGAIVGADRTLYAQGYEAADPTVPWARGAPLAPGAWVDVTFAAGSVASTADDMMPFLRTLANAAQGRGGLGLPPELAKQFTTHAVSSDTPGMTYGNGLMHVTNDNRSYLHHTGGMVTFSSSFHVDTASGVGAFASSTVSGFLEYRPRLLTRFAVDAVTNALAGRPLPAGPSLETPLAAAAAYVGHYSGPSGKFEVRPGAPLTIVADGVSAPLQPWGGELYRTTHPKFRQFTLMFGRTKGFVTHASWGSSSYLKNGRVGVIPAGNSQLAKLAGRYVNDSPWVGAQTVVERGGKLWFGTDTPLTKIGDNLWRVGQDSWSPERASFANFIDGRPQTLIYSGEKFLRHDF
jgi:CubicO group peptidase (beta-lactamase class C family)